MAQKAPLLLVAAAALLGAASPSIFVVAGFTFVPQTSIKSLLKSEADNIAELKEVAANVATTADDVPTNDVFYLRYLLGDYETDDERNDALATNMKWRCNEGKAICDAAKAAVAAATSSGDKWDNGPVRDAAPHASAINEYITSSTILTTTSSKNDLVYCIRAGFIDDKALMSKVSVDQMVEFFLYCKEVNAEVADTRSIETGHLVQLITANDLSGLKLIGGDAAFRKSLSAASKQANDLYPALNGPTLLLNLPKLLSALVKVFTPLFSEEVRQRLKFARGPLADVDELADVLDGGKGRVGFLADIDRLVYGK